MKNMTEVKRAVAELTNISPRFLDYVLSGRKDPSKRLCLALEIHTGIGRAIWFFGTAEERRSAFKKFAQKAIKAHDESYY